jgi:hypothetical protein
MKVRITQAMVREFDERALTHAPFDRMTAPGEYEITDAEAIELRSDAAWQGNVDDCSQIESSPATKAMYRRLLEQTR